MSNAPESLAAALAALQTQLPEIKKSETAEVQTKQGSYSYSYANLSAISQQILPLMGELGLSWICKPTMDGDKFVLVYKLMHVSGQSEEGSYPLPTSGTPQAVGSAITYGRRYCLCSVTGIAPEDDDDASAAQAESASARTTAQRARRPQPAPTGGRGTPTTTAQRAHPPATAPPLPSETSRDDQVSNPQLAKLAIMFGEAGVTDREERLAFSASIVGRELSSGKDLTKKEASGLIQILDEAGKADDPIAYLGSRTIEDVTNM